MRKIALFCLLGLAALTTEAQTRFGIKAGLNLSDVNGKSDGESLGNTTKMTPGFHAGVIADFSISDNVFVQPGILVSQKGFRIEESVMGFTIKNTTSLLYAEIPVNIGYRLELGDNAKLYFMAGPYVGYGITGKSKTQVTGSPSETEDVEWGNEAGELKRLDFGVNAGAGVEISNILIGAQYGLGLSNNIAEGDKDNSFKNAVIGISLGYLFGGK